MDVMTPPFAESITQGEIRWEKGEFVTDQVVIFMSCGGVA